MKKYAEFINSIKMKLETANNKFIMGCVGATLLMIGIGSLITAIAHCVHGF